MEKILYSNTNIFDGNKIHTNSSLVISDSKIVGFGEASNFDANSFDREIDCKGMLITESFIDSHTHLLSYASYLSKPHIDYGEINSKSDLIHQIESIVNDSNEYWIRIFGLNINENSLNINKNDLDQISTNVPIVITLDSLHGNLLNTKALDIIGITEYSNEPNGVTFDRQINNGKLSGYIFEGEYLIDEHIPKSSISDLTYKMEHISQIYEDNGYTLINDASINNDYKKFELLVNITSTNHFVPKIIFMPGFAHLSEFSRERLHYNNTIGSLRIGHCKIMLTSSSGKSVPNFETLSNQINDSHRAGFPVAIHAVDNLSVKVAIQAISANPFENDRIEHASELYDEDIQNIQKNNIHISTHPSFIFERGDSYINDTNQLDLNSLYRIGSLINSGITVGYSSDAPVSSVNACMGIYANLTRCTRLGKSLNISEKVSIANTLKMLTTYNKTITNSEGSKSIKIGHDTKMLLIDMDINNIDKNVLNNVNSSIKWIN